MWDVIVAKHVPIVAYDFTYLFMTSLFFSLSLVSLTLFFPITSYDLFSMSWSVNFFLRRCQVILATSYGYVQPKVKTEYIAGEKVERLIKPEKYDTRRHEARGTRVLDPGYASIPSGV